MFTLNFSKLILIALCSIFVYASGLYEEEKSSLKIIQRDYFINFNVQQPTSEPTLDPSHKPTNEPTGIPSALPSYANNTTTNHPSQSNSLLPTSIPTSIPSFRPSRVKTSKPTTANPTSNPSDVPSVSPTSFPSISPCSKPSGAPTIIPTSLPSSYIPTVIPSTFPSNAPTIIPTVFPSTKPTNLPSVIPSSVNPSVIPTEIPTINPTEIPSVIPSNVSSSRPTRLPSSRPSYFPSNTPTNLPSEHPSNIPSSMPTDEPSCYPSYIPSDNPTSIPTAYPSSIRPTRVPSSAPTSSPNANATFSPSSSPSSLPTTKPSRLPTVKVSKLPSNLPSIFVSTFPTVEVSKLPTSRPTSKETTSFPTQSNVKVRQVTTIVASLRQGIENCTTSDFFNFTSQLVFDNSIITILNGLTSIISSNTTVNITSIAFYIPNVNITTGVDLVYQLSMVVHGNDYIARQAFYNATLLLNLTISSGYFTSIFRNEAIASSIYSLYYASSSQGIIVVEAPNTITTSIYITEAPTNPPIIKPMNYTIIVVPVILGFLFISFIVFSYFFIKDYLKRQRLKQKRNEKLQELPIHQALYSYVETSKIIELIGLYSRTILEKDYDEKSAVDIAMELKVDNIILIDLIKSTLPIDFETTIEVDSDIHGYTWTTIVQRDEFNAVVIAILDAYPTLDIKLGEVTDEILRPAISIASPLNQKTLQERSYFMRRYQIMAQHPEYKSKTSLVYIGYDHHQLIHISSTTTRLQRVAIKLFDNHKQYERELRTRAAIGLTSYVAKVFDHYSSETNVFFRNEIMRWGFSEYLYCIVMEAGDRDLETIISRDRIAGKNAKTIRHFAKELAIGLNSLHSNLFIHGDVKPFNIMLFGDKLKLVDLDESREITDSSFDKFSSAYLPPEYVYLLDPTLSHDTTSTLTRRHQDKSDHNTNSISVFPSWSSSRNNNSLLNNNEIDYNEPVCEGNEIGLMARSFRVHYYQHDDTLEAEVDDYDIGNLTIDSWSYGIVLFRLLTGRFFFKTNSGTSDGLSSDEIINLKTFTDEYKRDKLSIITNPKARNLVSLLLMKHPEDRIIMDQVLQHPYIIGTKNIPMIPKQYDVFISFRVKSDFRHAKALYDIFSSHGIRVWWWNNISNQAKENDEVIEWKQAFVEGIMNSRIFIPILSRDAINHPLVLEQNFSKLSSNSPLDHFLLELSVALELNSRKLLSHIYPVMIGDEKYDPTTNRSIFENYFTCGSHPSVDSNILVTSVMNSLIDHFNIRKMGSLYLTNDELSIANVLNGIIKHKGNVIDYNRDESFITISNEMKEILQGIKT